MSVSGYKSHLPLQPLFGKYLSHTNVIQVCCITQNLSAYCLTPILSGTKLWFLVHLRNLSFDWLFIVTVEKAVTVYNITSFSIRENLWANIRTPGSRHVNFQETTTISGENLRRWFKINWKSLNLGWLGAHTHAQLRTHTFLHTSCPVLSSLSFILSTECVCTEAHTCADSFLLKILLSSR